MLKSAFTFAISVATSAPSLLAFTPAPALVTGGDEMKAICPVTGKTIPPGEGVKVTIRNKEYVVIDRAAADKLAANPDQYLNPDGTPKNAEKKDQKPY